MSQYENGKSRALHYALECALRDREGYLDAIKGPNFDSLPREEALATLSDNDRENFLRAESYIRDFKRLRSTLQ
ncbi:hypothetical protein V0M98_35010 (plasmid) [Pseudomonas silesiensis]|uniref:hypothetical protein n=1 Tax=Pseudomonas silesiensis TaxID=1853130 RepID=UPI0030CD5470